METKKKVTLHDIAKEIGLSVVTVSKVINCKDLTAASKEKVELINQTALRLGYNARIPAEKIIKTKPLKVGVISVIDKMYNHPFYRSLFDSIKEYGTKNNIYIQFFHDFNDIMTNNSLRDLIDDNDVKSIIMVGECFNSNDPELKIFKSRFENVVSISTYFYSKNLNLLNNTIVIDTYYSSKNVLDKLIKSGRKKVLLLCGPGTGEMTTMNFDYWRLTADGRAIAYYEVMKENDITLRDELIYNCEWDPDKAHDIIKDLIMRKVEFDSIFAGDDMIAIACMKVLNKYKISIPEKVAVIGFNNQEFSRYTSPSLSSIDIHYDTIGSMAIELIKYKNDIKDKVPLEIIVPANFVKRKSCGL